jgi:chaperone required for assembly of F1-ATPase
MRDMLEEMFAAEPLDPSEAARRNMRPALKRRFYTEVGLAAAPDGFAVMLDGRPVKTPARRPLAAPTRPLGEALVTEWDAQREHIDPAAMPLTRLANTIIDGVAAAAPEVVREIEKYLGSDLVCYRAEAPDALVARQRQLWDPILAFAQESFGARFVVTQGLGFVTQPAPAVAAARGALPGDPWRLGAVHAVMTLTGSALIALALADGQLTFDAAWTAAHVDEDWNMERWGQDPLALERRAVRRAEMQAAARVLAHVPGA